MEVLRCAFVGRGVQISFCNFFVSFYTIFAMVAYNQPPVGLNLFDDDGQARHIANVFQYLICTQGSMVLHKREVDSLRLITP